MPAPMPPVIGTTISNPFASAFTWFPDARGDRPTGYEVQYRVLKSRATFDAVGAGTTPRPADTDEEAWETWIGWEWPLNVPYHTVDVRLLGITNSYEGQPATPGFRVRVRSVNDDGASDWVYVPSHRSSETTGDVASFRRGMVVFSTIVADRYSPVLSIDPNSVNGYGFRGFCHGGGGRSGREIYVLSVFRGSNTDPATGDIVRETIIIPNQSWSMVFGEEGVSINFSLRVVGINTVTRQSQIINSGEFSDGGVYIISANQYVIEPPVNINTGERGEQSISVVNNIKIQIASAEQTAPQTDGVGGAPDTYRTIIAEINYDAVAGASPEEMQRVAAEAATGITTVTLAAAGVVGATGAAALALGTGTFIVNGVAILGPTTVAAGTLTSAAASGATVIGATATVGVGALVAAGAILVLGAVAAGTVAIAPESAAGQWIAGTYESARQGVQNFFTENTVVVNQDGRVEIIESPSEVFESGAIELTDLTEAQKEGAVAFARFVERVEAARRQENIDPTGKTLEQVAQEVQEAQQRRREQEAEARRQFNNYLSNSQAEARREGRVDAERLNQAIERRNRIEEAFLSGSLSDLRRPGRQLGGSGSSSYTEGEFDDLVAIITARILAYERQDDTREIGDAEVDETLAAALLGQSLATYRGDVVERWLAGIVNITLGFREVDEAPVIVRVVPAASSIRLEWTDVLGAATFEVETYPATGNLVAANRTSVVSGITVGFAVITGLLALTEYRFRVRGVSSRGNGGPWSDIRTASTVTPPPDPITVRVSGVTSATADYRFNTVSDATTYEIQRSTNSGFSGAQTFTLTHPTNTYQDTLLAGSTQYFVRGRAIGVGGTGAWGPTATFTTRPAIPETAPIFTISGITATAALIQWQRPPNATGVRIEWSESTSFPGAQTTSAEPAGTNYTITGLTQNRTYHVRMNAGNTSGSGPWSETQSFTTIFIANAPNLRVAIDGNGGRDHNNPLRRRVVGTIDNDANLQDVEMEWSQTASPFTPVSSARQRTFIGNVGDFFVVADNLLADTTYYFRARRIRREFFIDGSTRGDRDTQIGPWSQPVRLHTPDLYDQPGQLFLQQLQRPPGFLLGAIEAEFDMPPEFQSFTNVAGTDIITLRYQVAFTQDFSAPDLDLLSSGANRNPSGGQPYMDGDELLRSYPIRPSNERADFIPDTTYYFRAAFLRELPRTGATPAQHSHGQWSGTLAIRTPPPAPLNPPRVLFENFTSAQVEFDAATFPGGNITYTVRWGQESAEVGRSTELDMAEEYRITNLSVAQAYWVDYRINFTDGNGVRRNTPWSPRANLLTPLPDPPSASPDPLSITNVQFETATATWSPIPNIGDYQLEVATASGTVVLDVRTGGVRYDITGLVPGGRYTARARGFRYGVAGPWSAANTFETFSGFSQREDVLTPVSPTVTQAFSRSRRVAILVAVDFGTVFGGSRSVIRRYSLAGHDVDFRGETYFKTDQLLNVKGVGTKLGIGPRKVTLEFANKGADVISFVQEPYEYLGLPTRVTYALLDESGVVTNSRSFVFYNVGHKINENTMVLEATNFWRHLDTTNGVRTSYNDQKVAVELGAYSERDPDTGEQIGTPPDFDDLAFQSATIDFSAIQSGRIRRVRDGVVSLTGGADAPDDGEDYTRQVPYGENWLEGNVIQAWNPTETAVNTIGVSWVPGPERSDAGTLWTTVVYAVAEGELDNLDLVLFDMKAGDIDLTEGATFSLQTSGEDGYYTIPLLRKYTRITSARSGDSPENVYFPHLRGLRGRTVAIVERSLGGNAGAEFPRTISLSSDNMEWTPQHRGAGTALVAITFKAWGGQGWPGGWPRIAFKTRGKLVSDTGGPTLIPSTNPADVIMDFLLSRSYGCSVPSGVINRSSFAAARGQFRRSNGSTFYNSFLRGVVDGKRTIGETLRDMLKASQSELYLNADGRLSLLVKAPLTNSQRRLAFSERRFTADSRGPLMETVSSPPSSRYNRARVVAPVVNRALDDKHDFEAVSRAALEEDDFVRNEVTIRNPFLSVRRSRLNELDVDDRSHLRANAVHAIISSRKFRKGKFLVPDGLWGDYSGLRVGSIITIESNRRGWIGDKALLARVVQLDIMGGGDYMVHYQEFSDDIYDVGGPLIEPVAPYFRGSAFGGLEAEPGETLDRLADVPIHTAFMPVELFDDGLDTNGYRVLNIHNASDQMFSVGEFDFEGGGSYVMTISPSSGTGTGSRWDTVTWAPAIENNGGELVNASSGNRLYATRNAVRFQVPERESGNEREIGVVLRTSSVLGYQLREGCTLTISRHRG